MSEEQEIQMMENTTFELPMQKLLDGPLPKSPPLPSFTLSLKEITRRGGWRFADGRKELQEQFNADEEFDHLEIKFTIGGDDPRIKAFDVYTQYSGINTVLIKHAPKNIWPCGIAFYAAVPDWDDQQDRILGVGEIRPTKLEGPASYARATGLKAKSWTKEVSENGELILGICRNSLNSYGQIGEEGRLVADLGHTVEFDPINMNSGCALESHNPICSYEYTWRDYHPIPYASYNIWAYINDTLGRSWLSFPAFEPYGVAFATYQPEWLKAGVIIERTRANKVYSYSIKCIKANESGISSELVTITGVFMKYDIGRWVLLCKGEKSSWNLIQTSGKYWLDAVDWLRRTSGW